MARTYTHTPYVIPEIFRQIVAKVSANLAGDSDLDIDQVSFKFGTWIEVMDQLIADDKDPAASQIKYPLVVLLQQYTEQYQSETLDDFRGDILIVCRTEPTMKISRRYAQKFEPILNPIYAELKAVIANSRFFLGYNTRFSHMKVELPHMGAASNDGNTAYRLPDFLDGILMQDVQLRINQTACNAACVPAHAIDVLSYISDVTATGIGGTSISVTATPQVTGQTYTWKITSQNGEQVYNLGTFNIAGANTANLAALGIIFGVYVVTITGSGGAQAQIEVGVNIASIGSEIVPAMPNVDTLTYVTESEAFDYTLGCGLAPVDNYTHSPLIGSNETTMERIVTVENGITKNDETLQEPELGYTLDSELIWKTTTVETYVTTTLGTTLKQILIITLKQN